MKKLIVSVVLLVPFYLGNLIAQDAIQLGFDFSKHGPSISPDLYGIFYEDINFASDGGIYAELIRNRTFDESSKYWDLTSTHGSVGSIDIETINLLNSSQLYCLKLKVDTIIPEGDVRITNQGYWGINVTDQTIYNLSFFAKSSDNFSGVVTASLSNTDGTIVYAQQRVSNLSSEWKKYTCTLLAKGNDPQGVFNLSLNAAGSVYFDEVSLFPPTYKDRPNGMRIDLIQKLIDLNPKVMRFPGGSFVNGVSQKDRFLWKKTLGNIEDRSGFTNQWGYRTTNGVGFHEFLQLAEDLGASPLYVFNCGISNTDFTPYDQLDALIQYELEAIEYANGPVTSTYGAMRAANGHPEPFNIRYVEIGNESNQPSSDHYGERYIQFYEAIKAKYPDLICIGDLAWGTDKPTWDYEHPVDLIDEHYYRSPEWFFDQAFRYDSYSREDHKIYVGEYAVTTDGGNGNLDAALGEAAFMTGIERNADIIPMAAYAPLFGNLNKLHWFPDLIYFNSEKSFGAPSYYVQKLFATNIGSRYVPNTDSLNLNLQSFFVDGGIGVGSNLAQVQYDSVRVYTNTEVLIDENFESNSDNWSVEKGNWSVENSIYKQSNLDSANCSIIGNITDSKYTLELKARKTGGEGSIVVMFKVQDKNNYFSWTIGSKNNTRATLQHCVNGKMDTLAQKNFKIENDIWYALKVVISRDTARFYVDNKSAYTQLYTTPKNYIYTSCTIDSVNGDIYWKAINYNDSEKNCHIQFQNLPENTKFSGTLETMSHANLSQENTLEEPNAVKPVETEFNLDDTNFDYSFPAHSLSVFHLYPKSSVLASENSVFSIPENSMNASAAGIVVATGAEKFKFKILTSTVDDAFTINDSTGKILVNDSVLLNYEKNKVIVLTVSVKDAENDSIVAARSKITVNLTDVNEKPILLENTYYVFKNETIGSTVGSIFAKDEDKSQTLNFAIKSQSSENLLNINSSTGELSVASLPSSISSSSIKFIVTATDNGASPLSDEKEFTLNILDEPVLLKIISHDNAGIISVFPNPAGNQIQVNTKGLYRNATLKIIDNKGRILNSMKINQDNTIVNTSSLANGIYYIQIIENGNILSSSSLIIQR